ncbi:MAG TPA: type II toxin-antitoxin system Phd/YefM family antitoxin [Kaistia sp.]|jgi:prevent-host-death family protein|nr:type II toxin-antitoxin system Phd/YefM family antitoxin [Kaistia sp.]
MAQWQLQDAKARFSEVVKRAAEEGPQVVTVRGKETAVVLSAEDYRRLEAKRGDFVDLLLQFPEIPDEVAAALEGSRPVEAVREIDL